jgi:hypothetical protein
MTILNKRNAVFGWAVWEASKRAARMKAKQAAKPEGRGPGKKGAVAGGLAAVGGAVWFWRRRRGGEDE